MAAELVSAPWPAAPDTRRRRREMRRSLEEAARGIEMVGLGVHNAVSSDLLRLGQKWLVTGDAVVIPGSGRGGGRRERQQENGKEPFTFVRRLETCIVGRDIMDISFGWKLRHMTSP